MSQTFRPEDSALWTEYPMTLGQRCNLHGLGLMPWEVRVALRPSHRVVGKVTWDHVCNVLGTSLSHKLLPVNIKLLPWNCDVQGEVWSPPTLPPTPSLFSCSHSFPAALDFALSLPGTKLVLHVTCHYLTNDMLWPPRTRAAMRPHFDSTFLPSLSSGSFIICLVKLQLDRAKLGVVWQDARLRPSWEKHQPWNPKIRTWVVEVHPSG